MKRNILFAVATVLALGVGAWFVWGLSSSGGVKAPAAASPVRVHAPAAPTLGETAPAPHPARPSAPRPGLSDDDDDDDDMTPAERRLSERIDRALDEEKLADALDCAREALACPNASVRQSMVDTLGWFGKKALPELTPFMADPDGEIAESARDAWISALDDIEDEPTKIGIAELAMNALRNGDALEEIANEYIGVDEKLAVESLLRVIEAGGSPEGVARAKETYEFVTGDEFTDRAAAEKWIAEEYTPPEPEE